MAPLQVGAALLPAAALRADPAVALTMARFGPGLIKAGLVAGQLTGPFSGASPACSALQAVHGCLRTGWDSHSPLPLNVPPPRPSLLPPSCPCSHC